MTAVPALVNLEWSSDLRLAHCVQALTALEPKVSEALVAGQTLQCRLVGWQRVDTSALVVLLALRRVALRAHARIEFLDPPESLKALARMSGVDGLLVLR